MYDVYGIIYALHVYSKCRYTQFTNTIVLCLKAIHTMKAFMIFDLILYAPSTIFSLNRDGSSWVEPVLS